MANLEISFQCMCLFVPEPRTKRSKFGAMHVLMPRTAGCHGACCGVPEHVVRLIHDGLPLRGVDLAGWRLELGGEQDEATMALESQVDPQTGRKPEIVDLTRLTKLRVPPKLLTDGAGTVNTHVVFRRGHLAKVEAEQIWEIAGKDVFMAHRITWRIDGVSPEQVRWTGPKGENVGPVDILKLAPSGGGEENPPIRFGIHHQPDEVLDTPHKPRLRPGEVTDHFRAFYTLFGVPRGDQFPVPLIKFNLPPGDNVHCGGGRARLG